MGNKFKIRDGMNDKIGKMRSEYTSAIDSYFANRRGNKSRPIPEMKKTPLEKWRVGWIFVQNKIVFSYYDYITICSTQPAGRV